jgi:hypothetical protein
MPMRCWQIRLRATTNIVPSTLKLRFHLGNCECTKRACLDLTQVGRRTGGRRPLFSQTLSQGWSAESSQPEGWEDNEDP